MLRSTHFNPAHTAGTDECKLFTKLMLSMPSFSSSNMAIEWCKHVNGTTIFPKLPVYLRNHHTQWVKNRRVRDAVEKNEAAMAQLDAMITEAVEKTAAADSGGSTSGGGGEGKSDGEDEGDSGCPDGMDYCDTGENTGGGGSSGGGSIPVLQHASMPQNLGAFPLVPYFVNGVHIGVTGAPAVPRKRVNGERGPDTQKRRKRRCMQCVNGGLGDAEAMACPGAGPTGVCRAVWE